MKVKFNKHVFDEVNKTAQILVDNKFASRLQNKDHNLWGDKFAVEAEKRLGWIDAIQNISNVIAETKKIHSKIASLNINRVVLCGMGGSTLGAQLLADTFGGNLVALDTTHPHEISEALHPRLLPTTLIIISTKSGSTIETLSQLAFAEKRLIENSLDTTQHILVITDPATPLEKYANDKGYPVVLGDPNIGGRFSVLSVYGITPALLSGADLDEIPAGAFDALSFLNEDSLSNPALILAAFLFEIAKDDSVLQFISSERIRLLPSWIEQLVAESTGKDGKGLLPLPRAQELVTKYGGPCVESFLPEDRPSGFEPFISIVASLVEHIYLWEVATCALSMLLQVNPFDQPDVEHTKKSAHQLVTSPQPDTKLKELSPQLFVMIDSETSDQFYSKDDQYLLTKFYKNASTTKYLVLQAFIKESAEAVKDFEVLTKDLENYLKIPVALSFGPRYLHSTGQIHKGGPNPISVLQVAVDAAEDYDIPGKEYSFGDLEKSWVLAERKVHKSIGNNVLTLKTSSVAECVAELQKSLV
ncbi:MAG TPA: hypothetical protein VLZ31_00385 [Microbacteriaceae bacterium]|nr:hypothetical protein [Microbacteriaceae bacterium]